jgi:hypothetical protein
LPEAKYPVTKIGNNFKTISVKTNVKLILPLQSHIHINVSEQLQAEAVLPSRRHPGYTMGMLPEEQS